MKVKNLKINVKRCALLTSVIILCSGCSQKKYSELNIASDDINELNQFRYVVINEEIESSPLHCSVDKNEITNNTKMNITISFAGDCTLGNDKSVTYFDEMVKTQNNDYSYFLKNVKDIFSNDDYTLVNLETTFTDAKNYAEKAFNFKGDYDYVNILKEGSVEGVNIANNHSHDYLEKGYQDTINTLESAGIDYSGDNYDNIEIINGIKFGFIGFKNSNLNYDILDEKLDELKLQNVDIIIASCHWGVEREYQFNQTQQDIAHYLIDNGADVVIGHHPHVLQGIEKYNGKYIVYSLGNFCFGGNSNPKDKDSMIFRETFAFNDNELEDTSIEIIPCSISSASNTNNFQPTPLIGKEKDRVLEKIKKYSCNFNY